MIQLFHFWVCTQKNRKQELQEMFANSCSWKHYSQWPPSRCNIGDVRALVPQSNDWGGHHDSWRPHGLEPARLLCPWDSPGQSTGVGSFSFLQGIFLTQGSNPGLLHCRLVLYHLSHQGSPEQKCPLINEWISKVWYIVIGIDIMLFSEKGRMFWYMLQHGWTLRTLC